MTSLTSRRLAAVSAVALGLAALGACGSSGGGGAAEAPGDQITMIVPFAAGGGSDLAGRAIAGGLEEVTGATVSVENITGGSGAVGYGEFLARQGDGTVLLSSETSLTTLPILQDVPFTAESFTPIMKVGEDYSVVVVDADSEYQTCNDVVDAAGEISVGTSGTSGPETIAWRIVQDSQDVTFDFVNYESGGEVVAGLMGGHIQVAALNPGEVMGQLESGDLRGLCAFAPERYEYPILEDIPTGVEQGLDVTIAQWRGFIAAGEISEEHRQYWIEQGRAFAETDAYDAYVEENLLQPAVAYGDEFASYLQEYDEQAREALGE
ncbi:tripartite tricarboxylate transporter substrate binding protein [Georgenia alba]|uniref:Tripartite tricarboxylate transporter substrate binding protein n=1 Tax=Georgenia alba TaxID=2233858 RepID=A0ABW2Q9D7_9MICO